MSKQGKSKSKVSKTSASKGAKSASKKTSSRLKSKSTNSKVPSKPKCASKVSKSNTAGISLHSVTASTLKKIQIQYVRQKNPNFGKSCTASKRPLSYRSKVQSKKSQKSESDFDVVEIEVTVDKLPPGVGKSIFSALPELCAVSHTKSKPKSTMKSKSSKSQVKSTAKASKSNRTGKTKGKKVKSAAKSKKSK